LRDAAGQVVPGAYGIGLAAGFVPWGALGGEPSFRGNANGLWLWQNNVGQMIVDAVLPAEPGAIRQGWHEFGAADQRGDGGV
jgi:hypothetical protein